MNARFTFSDRVRSEQLDLRRTPVTTLQVNLGKLCNQACLHCHVEAGPNRTENMNRSTVDRVIELMRSALSVQTVDLTGGAPELNPHFRDLVSAARGAGKQVIDRCNLTVLHEPGQEDTAEFLAQHRVKVVASMPCYSRKNVDQQRGKGVFGKSISSLLALNELGYGRADSGLELDLVYNPGGAFLPPSQASLESDYKQRLREDFGIEFSRLLTLTNMPIKRFETWLRQRGVLDEYAGLLADSFNVDAAAAVMCRSTVSVGWEGTLYDCDFNQMLELELGGNRRTIWDVEALDELERVPITFGNHCYGCTAGSGSSCGGALT